MNTQAKLLFFKKRLKAQAEALFKRQKNNSIPPDVSADWQSVKSVQKPTQKADVIVFGMIAFDFRYQRPQQIAAHLAGLGHRVFYVEHEFVPSTNTSPLAPIMVKKRSKNLYTVTLSADRNYFIYAERLSKNGQAIMQKSYQNLVLRAGIQQPVILVQHPFWFDFFTHLPVTTLLYDCFDDHSGFKESGNWVSEQEKKLVKEAHAVITSSQALFTQWKKQKQNQTYVITNGAGTKQLSNMVLPPLPSALRTMQKPIIGYHGALEEWLDVALIENMVQSFPSCSLVMIGAVNNKQIQKLQRKYKNLYLLGEISFTKVFNFVSYFDVALIPFLLTPLIQATLPVKFFEYLALGKPVVTTALPELKKYKDVCYYASSHEEYIQYIRAALKEKNGTQKEKRQRTALQEDWTHKADEYSKLFAKLLSR